MAEIWGHKWGSQYGATADYDGEWAEMLLSLSMVEIAKGLEAERNSEEKWPSPIPVFRKNAEGGAFNFNQIFEMCVHWSDEDQLKLRGLKKTREGLFIMRLIGSKFRVANQSQAERLVRFGIEELEKHLEAGNELPDFLLEIEEFPRGEPKKFCLADFNKMMEA